MRTVWGFLVGVMAAGVAIASPPMVTLPSEIKGEPAAFITVRAKVEGGKWVKYAALDSGLSVFPAELLADKTVTVVVAAKPGRYRVLAYSGSEAEGSEPAVTTIVVGSPVVSPPPVDPPVDPPVEPSGRFFFLVVREAKPVPPGLVKQLTLPAWDELRKAGHQMTDVPVTEMPKDIPVPPTLPAVVTLEYSTDGKSSRVKGDPRPVPTTDDGVRGLLK